MNRELINNLRLDAGIARVADSANLVVINRDGNIIDPIVGLEKFAELIIEECLNVVKEVRDDCWSELSTEIVREYMKAQSDDTMIAIKKHFGVE